MDIAFITGSSRSGTSILGELIASHPRVNYVFEEKVWKKMETETILSEQKKKKLRAWMMCYKKNGKMVVEKNPRHIVKIPMLKSIFPEAKIIHIVRDGRDVACSLKTGLCGKTWAHVKPPNWKEIEQKYSGIIRCAWAWREIMQIAIRDLSKVTHLQVRYEDLLAEPEKVARRVMQYLDLPMHLDVINFCQKIQNNLDGSYTAKHQDRWRDNEHSKRIGRWQENMSEDEKKNVEIILRPILNRFGYK